MGQGAGTVSWSEINTALNSLQFVVPRVESSSSNFVSDEQIGALFCFHHTSIEHHYMIPDLSKLASGTSSGVAAHHMTAGLLYAFVAWCDICLVVRDRCFCTLIIASLMMIYDNASRRIIDAWDTYLQTSTYIHTTKRAASARSESLWPSINQKLALPAKMQVRFSSERRASLAKTSFRPSAFRITPNHHLGLGLPNLGEVNSKFRRSSSIEF